MSDTPKTSEGVPVMGVGVQKTKRCKNTTGLNPPKGELQVDETACQLISGLINFVGNQLHVASAHSNNNVGIFYSIHLKCIASICFLFYCNEKLIGNFLLISKVIR